MTREDAVVERLSPGEAFKQVAHEIRFEILRALDAADDTLAFEEVRDAVSVSDPGQVNYHLDKLCGRFVERSDDGYRLTTPGRRVVGAVLAGGYTKNIDADPVALDADCAVCDRELGIHFEDHRVRVSCDFCGFDVTAPEMSPGALEGRPRSEIPHAVNAMLYRHLFAGYYGYCRFCDGPVDREVLLADEDAAPNWIDGEVFEAIVDYDCRNCGYRWPATVPAAFVLHPAVVAFHHDHGIDLRETHFWNLPWRESVGIASVLERDPIRIAVPMTVEMETAVFVVDGDLKLIEEYREEEDDRGDD